MTLRLLLDQNLPVRLEHVFAALDVDAVHVKTLGLAGASVGVIWRTCVATGRAIVSKDGDFLRLRDRAPGLKVPFIWLPCGNLANPALIARLEQDWARMRSLLSGGAGVVELL
jgi:predicted nuclease of predicted toxin-antitoxin system